MYLPVSQLLSRKEGCTDDRVFRNFIVELLFFDLYVCIETSLTSRKTNVDYFRFSQFSLPNVKTRQKSLKGGSHSCLGR